MTPVYLSRSLRRKLLNYFLPTYGEVVLYIAIVLLLLVVTRSQTIIALLATGGNSQSFQQASVSDGATIVINKITRSFGMMTIFCFWLFLGSFIYSVSWFIFTLTRNLHQHHRVSKKISDFEARKNYWQRALTQQLAFITIVLSMPGYVYFFILDPWPTASRMALLWATNLTWFNVFTAIVVLLNQAVKLYVLHLLVRIFQYSIRAKAYRNHSD